MIAVLSDIHGNLEAFKSVLEHMDAEYGSFEAMYCLGDNIGYGPRPEEVCRLVQERGIVSVMGNHEYAMVKKSGKGWFNPNAKKALSVTERLITKKTREWIKELPKTIVEHGARFVHGMPPDSLRIYLFELDDESLANVFYLTSEDIAFVGHTHELEVVQFSRERVMRSPLEQGTMTLDPESRYMFNIGSVGQPRDGDNRAKYVVWDKEKGRLTLHCVEYDIATTVREIEERGLPEQYARRLW